MMLKLMIMTALFFSASINAGTAVDFMGNVKVLNNCTVKKSIIDVDLGQAKVSDFSSAGATSNSTPFDIPLDCKKGAAVKLKIDTASGFDAATGYIPFSSGNEAAKNIYLKLSHLSGEAIIPGRLYSIGTASNSGSYDVNLIARFVRWNSVITPGSTTISLTFTLQYD